MAREEILKKSVDSEGNIVSDSNELQALKAPYTLNGDPYGGGSGAQAFANTAGDKLYITGIYLKENAGAAETFQIFDGTVAAGTKIIDIDIAANGEPNLESLGPIGPFVSTDGIFVYSANTSDISIILSAKKIVKQATRSE